MPDPKAALRMLKHGIRVDYWKARLQNGEYIDVEDNNSDNLDDQSRESMSLNTPEKNKDPAKNYEWLVRISIPRRLVAQMSAEEMNFYDEEVDTDDVEDAKDSGIDAESAYMSNEEPSDGTDNGGAGGGEEPPLGEI